NVRLVYLCDVMESQRTKAAERFSKVLDYKPTLENDVRRIQEAKDVDAMLHLTPDHWHAPGACYAVSAGKHVYVEKPCSHNPEEGELLIQFQKKYNKVIQVGNQARSSEVTQDIIKEIHNGIIGETYEAITFYSNQRGEVPVAKPAPVPQGLDWDLFQGPAPRQEYKHDTWDYNWHWYGWTWGTAESGNNMIHRFDLARWAMQLDYPEKIEVNASKNHFPDDGWTMYDTLSATFTFPGNKIMKCDCKSRNSYNTYGAANGAIVFGSKGSVFLTGNGYKLYDRNGKLIKEDNSKADTVNLHFVNFLEAIRGKNNVNSPVDEAEKSTLLCHLANISYRIGKNFSVNSNNGKARDKDALKLWNRQYEPGWELKI
ncbi:MAG TPA: Gfo/Idh/MocA family oxidoreductase, partial [Mariniphaga sp.]|nr:Gfo/Idh/MocA family oxidoreductase [Mariniphaga sp.]